MYGFARVREGHEWVWMCTVRVVNGFGWVREAHDWVCVGPYGTRVTLRGSAEKPVCFLLVLCFAGVARPQLPGGADTIRGLRTSDGDAARAATLLLWRRPTVPEMDTCQSM